MDMKRRGNEETMNSDALTLSTIREDESLFFSQRYPTIHFGFGFLRLSSPSLTAYREKIVTGV